jgi:hypothetical protein
VPTSISVLDPIAPYREEGAQKYLTLDSLEGKVVGFIDNTKPNFDYLIEDLAKVFKSQYGVADTLTFKKRQASVPAGDQVMQELLDKCDLVITGSGD